MQIKRILFFISLLFTWIFLLSAVCVHAASIDFITTTDNPLSNLPLGNADSVTDQCDKINTFLGKTYCACSISYLNEGALVKVDRRYCGVGDVNIFVGSKDGSTTKVVSIDVDTPRNVCNTKFVASDITNFLGRGGSGENPWQASCDMTQYKAPDACLCRDTNQPGSPALLVDFQKRILAKNVQLLPEFSIVSSGRALDASSQEVKITNEFLNMTLDYKTFKSGQGCVPADQSVWTPGKSSELWDCSTPVYFDQSTPDVCCCEGTKCVKKSVFTKGIQVCGENEKQVPMPPSGNCKIDLGQVSKVSGMDLDVLQQRAATELNPLKFTDIWNLIGRFTKANFMNMGAVAMIMYIYAGFLWMTASGNSERAGKAKTILVWTSLGVVVILASYMLVSFVFSDILKL